MDEFLPALRKTGIFQGRKPFGMPDTSGPNVGQILNQVGDFQRNFEDQEDVRARNMALFQKSLQPNQAEQNYARILQSQQPSGGGGGAQGGMAPMQALMQARDRQELADRTKSKEALAERSGRFEQSMAEGRMRNEGDMARVLAETSARRDISAGDRAARLEEAKYLAQARAGESAAEIASRERMNTATNAAHVQVAGMPVRYNPSQIDSKEDAFRIFQNFKINNPDVADKVVYDDTSKSYKIDTSGLTPQQIARIQQQLQIPTPRVPGQTPQRGRTITQRNKRTGETRQVPVE